jgi:cobalt-zinc-cadmium efflux system outer membrane protein
MYLRRLFGACVSVCWVGSLAIGQAGANRPIDDLVRITLERNLDYLALKTRVTEAQALMRQAGLRPSPTLEVEAGTGAITGSRGEAEYSAGYFQTIERGGKREKRVAVAEKGIALANAELLERERELAFDIKTAAIAAQVQELKLASLRSALETNQESHQLTVKRVGLGDAAPLEEQLLLTEVNRAQVQIISAGAARDAALVELRSMIGLSPTEEVRLGDNLNLGLSEPQLAELQTFALEHRPDLQISKLLEE